MKKIYASSSAFLQGRLVKTNYDSGCLRSILIKSKGYRTEIDPKYSILGERNEKRYEAALQSAGIPYERESPVSGPVDGFPDVLFSGRRDFVIGTGVGLKVVELKATSSKTKLQMIRENRYVTENLAQLVAYMLESAARLGELTYSFFKSPTDDKPAIERTYVATFDHSGDILVDDKHSGFTVTDYLLHRNAAADAVLNDTVYDRPHNWDATFGSPCQWCPFKSACDKYDAGVASLSQAVEGLGMVKRER